MFSLALTFTASGQRLSLGVVGGTNITANFPITDISMPADAFGNPANRFQRKSGPRSFILGGSLEGHITDGFSIEASVLHRPLKRTILFTEFFDDGSTLVSESTFTGVRVWEFPVMLKYTLPSSRFTGRFRPFLAVGPSFRTQEDASATEPSQFGISAGVGAALRLGRFRLAPTVRYTRWAREPISPRLGTKSDQVELLTSFAYETDSDSRRLAGRKLEVGAVFGAPLTGGFPTTGTAGTFDERTGYLAGLTAQMKVRGNVSVEVNAIYRPLRARESFVFPNSAFEESFSVLTWQFPVLAKYRWARPVWTPFVETGPSFRLAGNLNGYDPSHFGITVGAGVETGGRNFRLSPALRYTRWARDAGVRASLRTNRDDVAIVFGVSF